MTDTASLMRLADGSHLLLLAAVLLLLALLGLLDVLQMAGRKLAETVEIYYRLKVRCLRSKARAKLASERRLHG